VSRCSPSDPPLDGLPAHLAAELAELVAGTERYADAAQAINPTRRVRGVHRKRFTASCKTYQLQNLPAPASGIALYLASLAKRRRAVSTIRHRGAAIARVHRQASQLPTTSAPSVLTVMEGIARVHGAAPNKKSALLRDRLLELIDRVDTSTTAGLRHQALLLVGFAVGLRRSELVALTVENPSPSPGRHPDPDRARRPTSRGLVRSCSSCTPSRPARARSAPSVPGSTRPRS